MNWLTKGFIMKNKAIPKSDLLQTVHEISDLYHHAPCGYHSLDKDGVYVRINTTELKWLGYTQDEVVGKISFTDLLTPASQTVFSQNFPLFKERGFVTDLEFELIRKDGSILPVMISATAICDKEGNFIMSRSTVFDMSRKKQMEQEIAERTHVQMAHVGRK
jgi:PAS domain S-box-containing protein